MLEHGLAEAYEGKQRGGVEFGQLRTQHRTTAFGDPIFPRHAAEVHVQQRVVDRSPVNPHKRHAFAAWMLGKLPA
jgi:hypothetical protein